MLEVNFSTAEISTKMFKRKHFLPVLKDYLLIFKIRKSRAVENVSPEKNNRDLLKFIHFQKVYQEASIKS